MEDSEKMSPFIEKQKKDLDKSEKRVEQSIIKSTFKKLLESNMRIIILLEILIIMKMSNFVI